MRSLNCNDMNLMATSVIKLMFEAAVRMECWHLEMVLLVLRGSTGTIRTLSAYMAER
jgi:fluoride ion exporter CrcB/FEX